MAALLPAFMTASCLTHQQTNAEIKALENLRAMTHTAALPPEEIVARIESRVSALEGRCVSEAGPRPNQD